DAERRQRGHRLAEIVAAAAAALRRRRGVVGAGQLQRLAGRRDEGDALALGEGQLLRVVDLLSGLEGDAAHVDDNELAGRRRNGGEADGSREQDGKDLAGHRPLPSSRSGVLSAPQGGASGRARRRCRMVNKINTVEDLVSKLWAASSVESLSF